MSESREGGREGEGGYSKRLMEAEMSEVFLVSVRSTNIV